MVPMEVIDCLGCLWIGVLNVKVLSNLDNRIPPTHRQWERLCQEVGKYCHTLSPVLHWLCGFSLLHCVFLLY